MGNHVSPTSRPAPFSGSLEALFAAGFSARRRRAVAMALAAGASPGQAALRQRLVSPVGGDLLDCAIRTGSGAALLERMREDRETHAELRSASLSRLVYPMLIVVGATLGVAATGSAFPATVAIAPTGSLIAAGASLAVLFVGAAVLLGLSTGRAGPARWSAGLPLAMIPDSGLRLLRDFSLLVVDGRDAQPSALLLLALTGTPAAPGSLLHALTSAGRAMAAGVECRRALGAIRCCRNEIRSTSVRSFQGLARTASAILSARAARRPDVLATLGLLSAGLYVLVVMRLLVAPLLIAMVPLLPGG